MRYEVIAALLLVSLASASCGPSAASYREDLKRAEAQIGQVMFFYDGADLMYNHVMDESGAFQREWDRVEAARNAVEGSLKQLNNPPARYAEAFRLVLEDFDAMERLRANARANEKMGAAEIGLLREQKRANAARLNILLD